MGGKKDSKRGPFRLGILLSSLTSPYHWQIFQGAAAVSSARGHNLIGIPGGPFNSSLVFSSYRSVVYEWINPEKFDTFILPASSLARYIDSEQLSTFLAELKISPLVCVGAEIPGYPAVKCDYYAGMCLLLEHLTGTHNARRICLVRGPAHHISSNEREKAYRDTLRAKCLDIDEDLILRMDTTSETGEQATRCLLPALANIDAIVTTNDKTAFDIIASLKNQGLRVPEDIIVTGYQNRLDCAFRQPSLTTVDEMMYEQGVAAASLAFDMLEGKEKHKIVDITPELKLRQSCGCNIFADETTNYPQKDLGKIVGLNSQAEQIEGHIQNILNSRIRDNKETAQKIISIFHQLLNVQSHNYDFELTRYIDLLRKVGFNLNGEYDIDQTMRTLVKELDFQDCFVARYQENKPPFKSAELIFAYRDHQVITPQKKILLSNRDDFLPADLYPQDRNFTFIIEPLYFRDKSLGYIVFEYLQGTGNIYEALLVQISGALVNEEKLKEALEAQKRFSDIALSSSDWLWEVDTNFRFIFSSDGVKKVLGYKVEEIIGRSIFAFMDPFETGLRHTIQNRLYIKKEAVSDIEGLFITKSNTNVVLLFSGLPIKNNQGELSGFRGVFRDITRQKEDEIKINYMAYYDSLTGLPNRVLLKEHLKNALSQAKRDNDIVAIIFIDLDRFKIINDTLGMETGDELLKQVAQRLKNTVRTSDTLARLGGDEFALILPGIKLLENINIILKKLQMCINEPIQVQSNNFYVTSSIGISVFPTDGADINTLLKKADSAMFKAKEGGKNRFIFFDKEMELKSIKRMSIENNILNALKKDELCLYYQPKVHCLSGKVTGFEALLRWQSPTFGMVSPLDFIPIAEDLGLIHEIGAWVLEQAVRQVQKWKEEGFAPVKMAINVSTSQFGNKNLVSTFLDIINKEISDHSLVELEITESIVLKNYEAAIKALRTFKEYGITIALDDFGTGYSSLNYLKQLPVDTVKIDKSFISDCISNPESSVIVKTIIVMAHSMNLEVVAEGVETAEELDFLRLLGCDIAQGYYFSKPAPAEEISKLLRSSDLLKLG